MKEGNALPRKRKYVYGETNLVQLRVKITQKTYEQVISTFSDKDLSQFVERKLSEELEKRKNSIDS